MSALSTHRRRGDLSLPQVGRRVAVQAIRRYGPALANQYGGRVARWGANKIGSWWKSRPRKSKSKSSSGKIATGVVMNEGTGGQYSSYSGRPGKGFLPKYIEDKYAPQVVQTNLAGQLKSVIGLQTTASLLEFFSPTNIDNFTGDKVSNVLCYKATGTITLNNIYLSNVYITLYDIVARKDCNASANSTPYLAWAQAAADESAAAAYTFVGSTPWQSECFNQFYKVNQVTNVVLGAGATHVHKVVIRPQRVINSAYSFYTTYCLKDLSQYVMITIHGSPANDTTTQTQVTIGAGGVNYVVDKEETYKVIQKQTPTISTNNTLLSAFGVAEQVVNLGGSTVTTNIEG